MCYVAPVMYHLFELQETVIIGLPTMQMAQDKWVEDLLPAIEASRYRELLPTSGEGSRGGMVKRAIRFRNDVTLRFMTAGGGDKQRAGYTARVLAITETDGMDEAGETSREADKIEQLEGRTRAYGSTKRVYLECTASIEKGRIWQEIKQGTDSQVFRPCMHCGEYVFPERENLHGWQEAESEMEAADGSYFACPACGKKWTEEQRRESATAAVLVHRGQKVLPSGDIIGDVPRTKTLGFRWSAIDNPFATMAELGAEEWRAKRSHDRDNAEKKMRQFVWCLPWDPPEVELTPLDAEAVQRRVSTWPRGIVPDDCVGLTVGVDTAKRQLHWCAMAAREDGSSHLVEYGEQETEADTLGVTRGLIEALRKLQAYFAASWRTASGTIWQPSQVWIDSGWSEHQAAIYGFCREAATASQLPPGCEVYRPAKGHGERQRGTSRYVAPRGSGSEVRYIGNQFHFAYQRAEQILLVHVNADHWKSELHTRLAMSAGEPGAVVLYQSPSTREHVTWSEHITAEVQKEEWLPGRGTVVIWDRIRRENHYLDASYLALAAGSFVWREVQRQKQQVTVSVSPKAEETEPREEARKRW